MMIAFCRLYRLDRLLAVFLSLLPLQSYAGESEDEQIESKVAKLLRLHEGDENSHPKVRKPYPDSRGFMTVGVGHNLTKNGIPKGIVISKKDLEKGLTSQQIEALLRHDIKGFHADLRREFPWFENLSEARKIVLLDMCFNLGIDGLKTFKKMLAYLQEENFELASEEMLNSLWATQVQKTRSNRLKEMMRTNKLPKEI